MDVILVAHGPRNVTKMTLRRLLRLAETERVHIVRAHERVRNVVHPGSEVIAVPSVGTDGVIEVARGLREEPVLLMHDDVALSGQALSVMASMLDEGADFVAPYTNERAGEQFAGPLPAIRDLDRFPRVRTGPARRVNQARHACLVGRAHAFADLGGSLVLPGSSLTRPTATIMLAPVVAAHDLSCNAQILPDEGPDILVASMIVRDEEAVLADTLAAVEKLVDRMEIFDTGSVDRTVEIARSFGANVTQIEWRDDFGWARTQALEACRDAGFVLMFDADERVEVDDPTLFRRWLRTWQDELDAVTVDVVNHRGDQRSVSSTRSVRVAKAALVRFEGALHEALRFPEGYAERAMYHTELRVVHHGYTAEMIAAKDKVARNIAISKAAYESDPNPKTIVDYARSLRMNEEADPRAEELFREALDDIASDAPLPARSYLLGVVGAYDLAAGDVDRAIERAEAALELVASEDIALVTMAAALCARGEWQRLVDLEERLAERPQGVPMFAIAANVDRYRAHVARAFAELGRCTESAERLEGLLHEDAVNVVEAYLPALRQLVNDRTALIAAIAHDKTGILVAQLAGMAPPDVTAEVAMRALRAGGSAADLVVIGLTAALVKRREDLVSSIAEWIHLVDMERRVRLAATADKFGFPQLAGRLEGIGSVGVA